jgi:Fe-S cluster assembly ATP-binding protein
MASFLSISGLHIEVEGKEVVKGLSLEVPQGEVHAIMGPNGSGKSSLVNALMGHPKYAVTGGSANYDGKDLLEMAPHERAAAGLFLAFQYPREIAGVTLRSFLYAAHQAQAKARGEKAMTVLQFKDALLDRMQALHMDGAFAERSLNQGFSGGEKKKAEVLQMDILRPRFALLDETDSGLDVDALKIVAEGVKALRSPDFSALVVTHYARILHHLAPDRVHVMVDGTLVESGGADLAERLEKDGYKAFAPKGRIALDA